MLPRIIHFFSVLVSYLATDTSAIALASKEVSLHNLDHTIDHGSMPAICPT